MREHRPPGAAPTVTSPAPVVPLPRLGSSASGSRSTGAANVLLLEADAADAEQVLKALGHFSDQFTTTWVATLDCAVATLVRTDFDCLIIGLGLPEAEGLEVVEVLRDVADRAALIVLTDRNNALLGFRALQGGVDEYFVRGELAAQDPNDMCLAVQYAVERARLKADLRAAEHDARALSAVVESTADAILTKNPKGIIRTWNRGAEDLYGYASAEVVGRHVDLLHPWDETESMRILSSVGEGQTVRGLETVHRKKNGDLVPVSLTVSPLTGPEQQHMGASVIARDISDRRLLEEQLTRQAMHDALTGLPNRALLLDRLEQALAEAARSGLPVAVFFVDLDHFKKVNDTSGHRAGDQLLTEVSRLLVGVLRPADTVARLGGDEFVIVCRNTDSSAAAKVARRVKEVLADSVRVDGRSTPVTASIGVAVCPPVASDAELLLQNADAAMYEAKARGRDGCQLFDESLAAHSHRREELVDDLREALRTDNLDVNYQPIIDLANGRVAGFEALARWNHPEHGSLPPALFVPMAEETGLVGELDRWVLERACRDAVALRASGVLAASASMAVNMSARTVGDLHLEALVRDVAAAQHLPPEALVIEVTETAVMHDPSAARRSLEALRRLGTGVALDDFGTGYSSLTYLRQMPVTHVKIDRSFVAHIGENEHDRAITACIIDLADKLGMQVVAEGVETAHQLAILRRLGCATGQGYHWSRPVPLGQLAAPATI
jgi:diguanylate cyclase (GGDEF)-like protein/PAS domain S-box-containing protein